MNKGKFIVLYGINNLGKTTQAKLLVERLQQEGRKAEYLKYPVYDLEPTGPMINNFLRGGNQFDLSLRESQILNVINRMQMEPVLRAKLMVGVNIVAEDYTGSGLSWGIGSGADEDFMKRINSHLLKEDLAFVFDGERFTEASEKTHIYEKDSALQERVRKVYEKLGKEFGWIKINANLPIETIHLEIWNNVKRIF